MPRVAKRNGGIQGGICSLHGHFPDSRTKRVPKRRGPFQPETTRRQNRSRSHAFTCFPIWLSVDGRIHHLPSWLGISAAVFAARWRWIFSSRSMSPATPLSASPWHGELPGHAASAKCGCRRPGRLCCNLTWSMGGCSGSWAVQPSIGYSQWMIAGDFRHQLHHHEPPLMSSLVDGFDGDVNHFDNGNMGRFGVSMVWRHLTFWFSQWLIWIDGLFILLRAINH